MHVVNFILLTLTMNGSTPNNLPLLPASIGDHTILRLNRIGLEHFQDGRFPEAMECFLSAMQVLKRKCSSAVEQQDLFKDDHVSDLSDACQEYTYKKTSRLGAILQPINICKLHLLFSDLSIQSEEACSKYTLIGFVLIFNLASTIHHHALLFDEQDNSTSETRIERFSRNSCEPGHEIVSVRFRRSFHS
jgi:hypothetical protein